MTHKEQILAAATDLIRDKHFARAENALNSLSAVDQSDQRVLYLYIQIFQALERFNQLIDVYETLLKIDSQNLDYWIGYSLALLQAKKNREAYQAAERARSIDPDSLLVLQAVAVTAMGAEEWRVAATAFETITRTEPLVAEYYQEWSKAEYQLDNPKRAINTFKKFLELSDHHLPEHHYTLGKLYFIDRKPEKAAVSLDRAISSGLSTTELFSVRAHCHVHLGEMDEARTKLQQALKLDPENLEAELLYRQLVKTPKGDPVFAKLHAIADRSDLSDVQQIHLGFLLGNIYQGIDDIDKAFHHYRIGNEVNLLKFSREGAVYDRSKAEHEVASLKKVFNRNVFHHLTKIGSPDPRPVFIVGLPRSGTTLLEQIISSHSQVEGRGELDDMHYIHFELMSGIEKGEELSTLLIKHAHRWQERYLTAIGPLVPSMTSRITDKMPANIRSLGLIALLFPRSHIIYIRRDPRDVALSIYCNIFDKGHTYATSLQNIAHFIKLTEDLADHWKQNLSIPFLEIEYEDIVRQQESKTREILTFLGLPWESTCLDFQRQKRAAMTISSIQVRQPLSSDSVGKWKKFEKYLTPFFEDLKR